MPTVTKFRLMNALLNGEPISLSSQTTGKTQQGIVTGMSLESGGPARNCWNVEFAPLDGLPRHHVFVKTLD